MKTIYHTAPKRSGHNWVAHMVRSWIDGIPISDLEGWAPDRMVRHFGIQELQDNIILIQTRDLLNWYASYTKGRRDYRVGAIPTWETITDEYYKPRYFRTCTVVRVYYDRFFVDRAYRRDICVQLGGKYNEKKLQSLSNSGHGSTFDKMEYHLRAQEMQVLTRYKQVPKEIYVSLFQRRPFLLDFYLEHAQEEDQVEFVKSLKL